MRLKPPFVCVLSISVLLSTSGAQPQQRIVQTAGPIQNAIQLVSDTAIAADIRRLESYGTRYAQFSHAASVAEWIRQRFVEVGVTDVDTIGFLVQTPLTWQRNVVATIPGSSPGGEELIIGAHYDSQSSNILNAPGADDNASGTAGIIEIARVLRAVDYQPRATIRFVAFAAEELGLLGSYDYAGKAVNAGSNIVMMQNYDMIAYRDKEQSDRNVSVNEYQNALAEADLMVSMIQTYTTLTPHKTWRNTANSDSWPFFQDGFKAVFVIEDENDFNPRYHSPQDSSVYLDFSYAAEIVQAAVAFTITYDGQITRADNVRGERPRGWTLEQNYPNPFNPNTTISYDLTVNAYVRMWVHNVLGETVAELERGKKTAGTHTVRWIPEVPSGVYYYTLQIIPDGTEEKPLGETRKMVLIR